MNKQTLIESINKQRKLMGLNEMMDVNVDANNALSGNKLDLGMVPLEEIDPEDDDEATEAPISFDDDRSDDEMDFYRGEDPMSLGDEMDSKYPDPNEREWHMNRYSGQNEMMNEAELDELFGTGIGAGIKNAFQGIGQNFQAGRLTKQIKTAQSKFDKVIAQANTYLTKNEKIFNDLMSYQKTLASLNANDPNKKSLESVLNNSKATWNALKSTLGNATKQINQMNQATSGASAGTSGTAAGATGGSTTTGAGGTGTNPIVNQSGQTAPANIAVGDSVMYKGNQYKVSAIPSAGNVTLPGIGAAVSMQNVQKI